MQTALFLSKNMIPGVVSTTIHNANMYSILFYYSFALCFMNDLRKHFVINKNYELQNFYGHMMNRLMNEFDIFKCYVFNYM